MSPSRKGANGRDARGRFVPGNAGGPGNPHAAQVARLREELLQAVTAADLRDVIEAILVKAKTGDPIAAKLLFDRLLGPAIAIDIMERIEALETVVRNGG